MAKIKHKMIKDTPENRIPRLGAKIGKKDIQITDEITNSWQGIVDTMAEMMNIPTALITKLDYPYIEVFRSNESGDNPYQVGEKKHLEGHYCEKVIRTKNKLLVSDASVDPEWNTNPDKQRGMLSYLGVPLLFPDGEVFGTICVLDSKKNKFQSRYEKLILQFKELVEAHLALLYQNLADRKNLENILDNLTEGIIAHDRERNVLFFNRAAEKITGYKREEILGHDCYDAFGSPFCGGRCSFSGNKVPHSWKDLEHSINILTKQGDARRIEMNVTGMSDVQGRFIGVLVAFRDVTDLIGLKIQLGDIESFTGIVGRDPKMLQIYRQIRDLATTDYPVHITGETGTGKELVAAAIHNESRRAGAPFVPINCAALPEGTIESEIFGHVKGAFTGAIKDKKGRFDLAHKGTMFLDEVADLSQAMQAKLLRVIQLGTFERVGGEKTISVDVRIISATNKNLKREVEKNNFREDLYYRINVVPIHLPPLRERKGDIPLLVRHFLELALEEGQKTAGISEEALAKITEFPWPGNVRELQSALRFALLRARGRVVQPKDLPSELENWAMSYPSRGPSRRLRLEDVRVALEKSGGNKAKAARILGVGRATLYRFLADAPYPYVS